MLDFDSQIELRLSELLSDRPDDLCQLVLEVRRLIVKSTGDCTELLYQTYAVSDVFTYTHRLREAFLHIAVYAEHVNLGFNHGAALKDPHGLLEGSGKLIRHIRLDSVSTVLRPEVWALVDEAITQGIEMAEGPNGVLPRRLIDKSL